MDVIKISRTLWLFIKILKLFHQYRYVITSITNNFNICKRMDRGQWTLYFILKINGVCLLKFINSDILYFIKSLQSCTLEFLLLQSTTFLLTTFPLLSVLYSIATIASWLLAWSFIGYLQIWLNFDTSNCLSSQLRYPWALACKNNNTAIIINIFSYHNFTIRY